jgi:HK97 family phage major capsid protein
MAATNVDHWIPEEFDSEVIARVAQVSAVEVHARKVPMGTETKSVPRSIGMGVAFLAKSGSYGEDTTANDEIILKAAKFAEALRVAEEDVDDSLADIIATKQKDWATSYAKVIDNACLAVTAATGATVPFYSLYYQLQHADSNAGYSASANYSLSGTGGVTYSALSVTLGQYESGDYFDEANTLVIAHPSIKADLRGVLDKNNRPIFVEGLAGTPGTVFGHPVVWELGAKTSAVPTSTPAGNPLFVVGNADYLLLGVRSGPESVFIDGRNGVGALTDESILKMRARRAFGVGNVNAFAMLENNSGA